MKSCLSFLCLCVGVASAAETAKLVPPGPESWATFRNGGQQRGVANTKLPAKLQLLWVEPSGAEGAMIKSTAAIAGGRVYAASLNGDVFCRDLKTGERLWTYQSQIPEKPGSFIPGFKAGVAVSADTVYIGDEEGVFHAIDRTTGAGKWKFETKGEITSSANFDADHVLFASHDSNLYCLNVADGAEAWHFATQGQVYGSPPIVGNVTFVAGCDQHLRVINVKTGEQQTDMPFDIQLISSPAVVDNMLYVGTYGNEILAIDWQLAKLAWAYTGGKAQYDSSAAVIDRYVVAGSQDRKLHCIDRHTGQQVWTFGTKGRVDSSPVIVGERVFVGSNDGNVYGINLETGKEEWKHNDGRPFMLLPRWVKGAW